MSPNATAGDNAILGRCAICGTINRVNPARIGDGPKCGECGRPLHFDRPQHVTDGDFERVVGGTTVPVLVDFYADWCAPCRKIAPLVDDFAAKQAGRVLVLKLDTDANPATPMRFNIRSIPTLIAFRNGQEFRRHIGLVDSTRLTSLVE